MNVPWSMDANEDGTVKSDELRAVYRRRTGRGRVDHRVLPHRRAVSHTWFVLQELLGLSGVKTTMVPGPSTVHWSAYRSSWAAKAYRHVWGTGTDPASAAGQGSEEAHCADRHGANGWTPSAVPSCGYSTALGRSQPR